MKRFLVVVDMQKDFVDGALGTKEALAVVPAVAEKIRGFDGEIFVTLDTHFENYMDTAEGRKLPVPHCIRDTDGWRLNDTVAAALAGRAYTAVEKNTFGSVDLPRLIGLAAGPAAFSVEPVTGRRRTKPRHTNSCTSSRMQASPMRPRTISRRDTGRQAVYAASWFSRLVRQVKKMAKVM